MALQYTGQPQNVQLTQGGNDISAGNPIPTSSAGAPTSLGQKAMADSTSVAIASNQSPVRTNSEPASSAAAVNLASDTTPAFAVRGVYVGTGGTVKVDLATGTGISFLNVPDGTLLPIQATLIYSTANGTTASNLVVLG